MCNLKMENQMENFHKLLIINILAHPDHSLSQTYRFVNYHFYCRQ